MRYLILGGDSQIGQALGRSLEGEIYLTSRREPWDIKEDVISFDLEAPNLKVLPPVDVAFICAAITKRDICEEDKEHCFKINVTNTIQICKDLLKTKTNVIFLSSDAVFDNTYYGYTKKCAERALNVPGVSIIRLSKVITKICPLFEEWYTMLKNDVAIIAFSNLFVSPVYEDYAINSIISLANMKKYGIFQLSASYSVNYAQIAYRMANKLKKSKDLITTATLKDNDPDVTMHTKHTANLLNLQVPSPYDAVDLWMKQHEEKQND